jgi:uncharacterized membrane protein (DUF4010 family)
MKPVEYIAAIFSADNCASFARWATACTVLTGCWAVIHLVRRTGALPDPTELAALALWMTSPYGINKVVTAFRPADAK